MGMNMIRISFLATIFLAVLSESTADNWHHHHPKHHHHHHGDHPDDQTDPCSPNKYGCEDVYNNFEACQAYIVGEYDDAPPECCNGLVYLNNIAQNNEYSGASRICQCIEQMAADGSHPPYSEERIEYLYYSCNIHLSFPISERMDCNSIGS